MATHRRSARRLGLVGPAFLLGLAIMGCGKSKDEGGSTVAPGGPPSGPPGGGPGPGGPPPEEVLAKLPGGDEFAAGKKVYANNNCANCHKLGETGGGKGGGPKGPPGDPGAAGGPKGPGGRGPGGPDLTATGANPEHTARWLADHVRDPKSHKPQSRMPAYGSDKIGDTDLTALAEYLASRK